MKTTTFALIIGIAYLGAGARPDSGRAHAAAAGCPAHDFHRAIRLPARNLPVNVLHTAVHLAIGFWGLMAWRRLQDAKVFLRTLAILYGALAVMGLVPGLNNVFGFIPLHGHDVWLHAGTAALAAYFGWRSEVQMERRQNADRRQRMLPVARERRLGPPTAAERVRRRVRRKKTLKSWAAGAGRRDVIKRAAADVARGLEDTDARSRASAGRTRARSASRRRV